MRKEEKREMKRGMKGKREEEWKRKREDGKRKVMERLKNGGRIVGRCDRERSRGRRFMIRKDNIQVSFK